MKKRGEMNKRAQVTVFLIIGVVILSSTAVFLYLREKVEEKKPEIDISKIRTVTQSQDPAAFFVQKCAEQTATEGFDILGAHGGFIYLDEKGLLFNPFEPTDSQLIEVSGRRIPYWYYMSSRNEELLGFEFDSERPTLEDIEDDIDRYVENNLRECLDDFKTLRLQGYDIEELGDIKSTAMIRDDDIIVMLEFPLKFTKAGSESNIKEYYAQLDFDFRDVYELATKLTESEAELNYLEDFTQRMISATGDVDPDALPPQYALVFGNEPPVIWVRQQVENKIEEMLWVNFPLIRIPNTLGNERIFIEGASENPYSRMWQALVNSLVYNVILDRSYDIEANLYYLRWPIFLRINTGEQVLRPVSRDASSDLLDFVGLSFLSQEYPFAYDVSYPVLVQLNDPNAFNGRGYNFMFALEQNIRNNDAVTPDTEIFIDTSVPSLFCNPSQRGSGDITIKTFDNITDGPVEDVQVKFSCADIATCLIGITNIVNNEAVLVNKFPTGCSPGTGIISFFHSDYLPFSQLYDVVWAEDDEIEARLKPMKEMNIKVMKRTKQNLRDLSGFSRATGSYLEALLQHRTEIAPEEEVLFSIERISQTGEGEYSTFALFSGDETRRESTKTIRLAPGTYMIDGYVMLYKNVTLTQHIEGSDCTWAQELFGCDDVPDRDIEVNLTALPIGGASFNWTVGDELYNNDDIVFYVATPKDIPETLDDLSDTGDIEAFSIEYLAFLRPTYE